MRRALIAAVAAVLWAPAAGAVDRDFKDIVNMLSDEFRTKPTRIPMFGLVNAVAFVARPAGVRHIDLAVFENLNTRAMAGAELRTRMERVIGRGWQPFVQVTSRRNGKEETSLVYMRPEGKNCSLLVTNIERNEATVVQIQLNPDGLQRWISAPRDSALGATTMGN